MAGVLLATALTGNARQVRFAPASNFSSGVSGALTVAVGDFNRDGLSDLVVTCGFNTFSVLLGQNPPGTFGSPVIYTLDFHVERQAGVADFNGDGILDIAVVGGGLIVQSGLAVLFGNGDGTFGAPSYFTTGIDGAGGSLALGDLNGDGNLDLFIGGNGASSDVLGSSTGSFQEGGVQSVAGYGVTIGDFNHDGNLDVAATSGGLYPQGIFVLLGNGDGTFQQAVTYEGGHMPLGITTGDFNRDGNLDLAVAASYSASAAVLLGRGDGTFAPSRKWLIGNLPGALVTADFNRDGLVDLAATDYGDGKVSALLGNGNGTFARRVFYFQTGQNPTSLATSDFNRDGSIDLVVTNDADSTFSILLNAAGTFVGLSSSKNPSRVGESVTFTTNVSATIDSSIPTGTVTFMDGSAVLGKLTLTGGAAAFTTSGLQQGNHKITVAYSGDNLFNPNRSLALIQKVR
jgi:hypothetical protein